MQKRQTYKLCEEKDIYLRVIICSGTAKQHHNFIIQMSCYSRCNRII